MTAASQERTKSLRELGFEAAWFVVHTIVAIAILAAILYAGTMLKPDPDSLQPKLIGTAASFFVPMGVAFLMAKWKHNDIARYVWISGMLIFATVCVWVLDLPTGVGMCEHCGALDKLWRTFFDIQHGSGLMSGDGLMVGVWIPLSLFGYAMGASFGLNDRDRA